jgi:hypothetical protein
MNVTTPSRIPALSRDVPVVIELFDLLWLDDRSWLRRPYLQRREQLAALSLDGEDWQTTVHRLGGGSELLAASLEGPRSVIGRQAANRLPTDQAAIYALVRRSTRSDVQMAARSRRAPSFSKASVLTASTGWSPSMATTSAQSAIASMTRAASAS